MLKTEILIQVIILVLKNYYWNGKIEKQLWTTERIIILLYIAID